MSLLVGSILFMGAVTGLANHQPHVPKGDIPAFRYSYASSFFMVTIAFCLDEISGVLSVYLFIIRHKETVKRRHARLNAQKSKAIRMQQYMRRQSRMYSASSVCGDNSRRSSHMITESAQQTGNGAMERDTSHMTMLTTVDSHYNLQGTSKSQDETTEPMLDKNNVQGARKNIRNHSHVDIHAPVILPPKEFQTSNCTELTIHKPGNSSTTNYEIRCKTTSV